MYICCSMLGEFWLLVFLVGRSLAVLTLTCLMSGGELLVKVWNFGLPCGFVESMLLVTFVSTTFLFVSHSL